jgi:hypothetical protein
MESIWETVATVSTRFEAEVIAARLADAGVPSRVLADDVGGLFPFTLHGKGVLVQVPTESLATAAGLLGEVANDG